MATEYHVFKVGKKIHYRSAGIPHKDAYRTILILFSTPSRKSNKRMAY